MNGGRIFTSFSNNNGKVCGLARRHPVWHTYFIRKCFLTLSLNFNHLWRGTKTIKVIKCPTDYTTQEDKNSHLILTLEIIQTQSSDPEVTKSRLRFDLTDTWLRSRIRVHLGPVSQKSQNISGAFRGDIILFVSSKRRRLQEQNLKTLFEKISFTE